MMLSAAARTDVGLRRSGNEDCFALAPAARPLPGRGRHGRPHGRPAGEPARRRALRRGARAGRGRRATLTEKLRDCVEAANQRDLHDRARPSPSWRAWARRWSRCWPAAAALALAHVGDSRAYLVRSGRIRQLTDDHSLVAELVRRQRDLRGRRARAPAPPRADPRARRAPRGRARPRRAHARGGRRVVLCSDGLTTHVEDPEIAALAAEESDLDEACARLVDLANARGGEDNVTVALVRCDRTS